MAKHKLQKLLQLGIEEEYMVVDPETRELKKPRTKNCNRRP